MWGGMFRLGRGMAMRNFCRILGSRRREVAVLTFGMMITMGGRPTSGRRVAFGAEPPSTVVEFASLGQIIGARMDPIRLLPVGESTALLLSLSLLRLARSRLLLELVMQLRLLPRKIRDQLALLVITLGKECDDFVSMRGCNSEVEETLVS